ncbi:glycosyltransferase family 2 protein [Croceibacter atlanticus]|uniref:glycosyltransferase family 2 protein n=1 Tax=Croceibacter atlanticus TaxID=313588 RepID=UPI0030DD38D2|tara:strand:- start:307447 stop:308454 length:1008 start_codon:yes stop_codon:yes gene_type:complete
MAVSNNLISVILPVFNGATYLSKAIESVLAQTYKNFELIIVDDCSTDNTNLIAQHYAQIDKRIQVIKNHENKNLPESLNIGHITSKGYYVTWMSDDNILNVNFLEVLLSHLLKKNTDFVFSNFDTINSSGEFLKTIDTNKIDLLIFKNIIGASFLYKKKIFQELDGYDVNLQGVEDYDFWLRVALNYKLNHVSKSLYKYRLHELSLTSVLNLNANKENFNLLHKNLYSKLEISKETVALLSHTGNYKLFSLSNYKIDRKVIKYDINSIQSKLAEKQGLVLKSTIHLEKIIRRRLYEDSTNFKLENLIWIIFNQPRVILSKNYSLKRSLKLIFEFL